MSQLKNIFFYSLLLFKTYKQVRGETKEIQKKNSRNTLKS